jgi:hypothetical protein
MRKPELSLDIDWEILLDVASKLRWESIALMFVCTLRDMLFLLEGLWIPIRPTPCGPAPVLRYP